MKFSSNAPVAPLPQHVPERANNLREVMGSITGAINRSPKICMKCKAPVITDKSAIAYYMCRNYTHHGCCHPIMSTKFASLAKTQRGFRFICVSCNDKMDKAGGLDQILQHMAEQSDLIAQGEVEMEHLSSLYKSAVSEIGIIRAHSNFLEEKVNEILLKNTIENEQPTTNTLTQALKQQRSEFDQEEPPVTINAVITALVPLLNEIMAETLKKYIDTSLAGSSLMPTQRASSTERIPATGPIYNERNAVPIYPTPAEGKQCKIEHTRKPEIARKNAKVPTFAEALNGSSTSGSASRKLMILGNEVTSAMTSNRIANDSDFVDIHFKDVITKSAKEITIHCASEKEANKLDAIINAKYNNEIVSERMGERLPRIKLSGFPINAPAEDLKQNLITANPELATLIFHVVDTYSVKIADGSYTNMVIESDLKTHSKIIAMKTLFLGLNKIKIYEQTNIMQCTNCCKFGHSKARCTYSTACRRCGEEHSHVVCTSQEMNCTNCLCSNDNGTTYNGNHLANDPRCPVFKERFQKVKKKLLSKGRKFAL